MTATPEDDVARAARRSPDAPALETSLRSLTYRELDQEVERISRALARLRARSALRGGLARGPLALVLRDRFHTVLLLHAGRRAGFAVAPLAPSLTEAELSSAIGALEPTAVFCDPATSERVRGAGWGGSVFRVREMEALVGELGAMAGPERLAGSEATRGKRRDAKESGRSARVPGTEGATRRRYGGSGGADPGYVVWTSGSSGRPRGVLLTSRSLATVVDGSAERLGLTSADRWLTTLAPAHVGGLATVLRTARLGSTLVVRDSFDAEELLGLASRGRVTHASLVPVMLRRVLAAGGGRPCPSPLRCLLVGGAHAPSDLVRRAIALDYPVALTYGMTETSSQCATAAPEKVRRKPRTVGTALPGVEIRIAENDEIRVRGPSLAAGYLGRADLIPLDLDDEGWYRTGDLGRWDEEGGDLMVTGRRSERIVTGGVTVDPREVEEALLRMPEIAEAVVVGIPDQEWGERVSAALLPASVDAPATDTSASRSAGDGITEENRRRMARKVDEEMRIRLSGPKRPRLIRILDAFPRTASGKVDRKEIRSLLREAADESGRPLP